VAKLHVASCTVAVCSFHPYVGLRQTRRQVDQNEEKFLKKM